MRSFFEAISVSCVIPAQSPADDERTVFENLSFAVERGEIVVCGAVRSGKSSLLTACARLNPHAHGAFALEGKGQRRVHAAAVAADVAYLPQKPILTGKNVAEAIRLPWTLAIRSKGGKAEQLLPDERIRTTLDAMGCEDIDLERARTTCPAARRPAWPGPHTAHRSEGAAGRRGRCRSRRRQRSQGGYDHGGCRHTRHGDHPHPPPIRRTDGHPHADAGQGAADRTRDDGFGGAGRERRCLTAP